MAGPRHRSGVRRPRVHAVRGDLKIFLWRGVYIEIFGLWGGFI